MRASAWRSRVAAAAIAALVAVGLSVVANCATRSAAAAPAQAAAVAGPALIGPRLGPAADAVPAGPDVQAAVTAAVAAAGPAGVDRAAVAVLDRRTGRVDTAGDAGSLYSAASLIKIAIVLELFATNRMTDPEIASQARAIIVTSDDVAASALLAVVGDDVLVRVAARLGLDGVGGATDPQYWGTNQISAVAAAGLVAAGLDDPVAGPWLLGAMRETSCIAADGWQQCYGVRAVDPDAAVKQGWMCCLDGVSRIHSVGLLGGDRYVVAILTEGEVALYGDAGQAAVSAIAQPLAALAAPSM